MLQTVYFTAASRQAAMKIANVLVQERLAACANVVDGVTSIYRWDDALQEDQEAVVFAKTTAELAESAIQRVQELHEYDCPCVVAWDIASTSDAYEKWVRSETSSGLQQ